MVDDKIKVCARVPSNIYDICLQRYDNITNAINAGLELLCRHDCPTNYVDNSGRLEEHIKVKELELQITKETIINLTTVNDNIVREMKERIKINGEKDREIINNLKDHINSLQEQLQKKDEQLQTKDKQIEKLNENMHGQVANIYNLTNTKLLMEKSENKKPWWQFW